MKEKHFVVKEHNNIVAFGKDKSIAFTRKHSRINHSKVVHNLLPFISDTNTLLSISPINLKNFHR